MQPIATAAVISVHEYPTDRGHFPDKVDANVNIVSKGPCKPMGVTDFVK